MDSGTFQSSAGRTLEIVCDRIIAGVAPEDACPDLDYDWLAVVELVRRYARRRGLPPEIVFRALGVDPQRPRP